MCIRLDNVSISKNRIWPAPLRDAVCPPLLQRCSVRWFVLHRGKQINGRDRVSSYGKFNIDLRPLTVNGMKWIGYSFSAEWTARRVWSYRAAVTSKHADLLDTWEKKKKKRNPPNLELKSWNSVCKATHLECWDLSIKMFMEFWRCDVLFWSESRCKHREVVKVWVYYSCIMTLSLCLRLHAGRTIL